MLLSNLNLLATAPGGVARLRELILTLAVQGKLVPQDPADEPASVLLQKIRAEKDRLIAEGKIKKGKPLAAITDEEKPFGLPVGWEWVRLGTLTSISTGKLDANAAVADGQYPFFTCSNTPLSIDKFSFDCPAVLLAGNGDFNLKHYTGKFDAYQRTYVIEPILLDLQFLYHTVKNYIGELTKNQRGSAIPYLKLGDITNPLIPLPPLAEQSRIVARVEELMRLCDALEAKGQLEATQHAQLLSTLLGTLTASATPEELANNWQRVAQHFDLLLDRPQAIDALEQTLLQLAVRGLLVPQDPTDEPASVLLQKIRAEKDRLIAEGKIKKDKPLPPITDAEKPFELPVGWSFCRLGDLLLSIRSGGTPSKQNPVYWGGDIPWASVKDLKFGEPLTDTQDRITIDGLQAGSQLATAGSILICTRMGLGKIGEALIDVAINQDLKAVQLGAGVDKQHFINFFKTLSVVGSGMTVAGIKQDELLGFVVPLPPEAEQSRIVTRITQLRRLCFELRQRLAEREAVQARLAEALVQQVA